LRLVGEQVTEEQSLSKDWRRQISELGLNRFETLEMLRLGFLKPAQFEENEKAVGRLREAERDLRGANSQLGVIDAQLANLGDIDEAIRGARSRRIERVRADSALRRTEREAARAVRAQEVSERRRQHPTFLGRGVSRRLNFQGGNPRRLEELGVALLERFPDISNALVLTPERLQWLVYERAASAVDHYSRFEIPKRTGGKRLISSPKPILREAQEWVRRNVLSPLPVHSAAMAFRPGLSIVDNARIHAGALTIVRIDLKDFFPSISFRRVREFFELLGYNPGVATVLALICTDAQRVRLTLHGRTSIVAVGERALPQGACTSPDLANLIAARLDRRLAALAQKSGWAYSRYADDLVFSSSSEDASAHRLIRAVTNITSSERFVVNTSKTKIMRAPGRQAVTGLVVNNGVNLSRRDQRRIRAFFHQCETQGLDAVTQRIGKDAASVARGHYAYMHMISPQNAAQLRQKHPWLVGQPAAVKDQTELVNATVPRYFEYVGENLETKSGQSSKFWEISHEGTAVVCRFGRIGATGQVTRTEMESPAEANVRIEKLIAEKTRGGYREMADPT
jgi:RNA-directed DNA polymerase